METVINKKIIPKYPAFKESGVECLGEIPSHWEIKRLASIGRFSASGIDKLLKKGESEVKIINYTNVCKNLTHKISREMELMIVTTPESNRIKNLVKKGDLIFLPSSETFEDLGLSALIDEDLDNTSFSYHVLRFKFSEELDHNFKKYFTNNSKVLVQFSKKGTGSIRKTLSRNDFRNTLVLIPPIKEQSAIAAFLDQKTALIDQAISIKKRQIELLKEYRQITIHNAVTKGLDSKVKFKDSGVQWIGQIPEHWKVESLKNILTERNEKNDPIITREILSLSIDKGVTLYAEKTTNLDRFKDDFSQYKLAHKGDLVFNSMNMIVGAVGVSDYFGCVSPVYYTYHGRHNNSNTKYYEYLFRCKTLQGVLYSLGKGLIAIDRGEGKYNTLRLKVSRDDLRSLRLPFPSVSEQNQIISYLETQSFKIDTLISLKEQEIEKLKEYKITLINSVVTGKIKVYNDAK